MFNKNSGLVQVWLRLIKNQDYTIDQVPYISNLRQVIESILDINENNGETK